MEGDIHMVHPGETGAAYRTPAFTPVLLYPKRSYVKGLLCLVRGHSFIDANREYLVKQVYQYDQIGIDHFVSYQACAHCGKRVWHAMTNDQVVDYYTDRKSD